MTELNILDRDRIGVCTEGECRNRAYDSEVERQAEMVKFGVESPEDYPVAYWAFSRNEPPDCGHL